MLYLPTKLPNNSLKTILAQEKRQIETLEKLQSTYLIASTAHLINELNQTSKTQSHIYLIHGFGKTCQVLKNTTNVFE